MNVKITLTPYEIMQTGLSGLMRMVENIKYNRKNTHGKKDEDDWQCHIEGALSEAALAKHLNLYWSGKGDLGGPDIGDIDVRSTPLPGGRLILHKEDPDDRVFYLLTGLNGTYEIRGWILARDGKKEEFWEDPTGRNRHAYFVPQGELKKWNLA